MSHHYADIVFTSNVKAAQKQYGSFEHNEKLQTKFGPNDKLGSREVEFIGNRDSFYMATVSETGWPYLQHRGGPAGFLKVISPDQLAFADFRGNTQLVSVGNLTENDRVSLFLMDYPNRRRLKLLGKIRVEDVTTANSDTVSTVDMPEYGAKIERIFCIDVVGYDWNCPQHITPRYTEDAMQTLVDNMRLEREIT